MKNEEEVEKELQSYYKSQNGKLIWILFGFNVLMKATMQILKK